jgi:DNA-binding NtrC family response regulator
VHTVAEDNKTNQKLMRQLLERLGFAADVANDGLEAVEAWHKKKYDVIVRETAIAFPGCVVVVVVHVISPGLLRVVVVASWPTLCSSWICRCRTWTA